MADRVDAPIQAMQLADAQAMLDRAAAEPEREELAPGHDAVLILGELGDEPVHVRVHYLD